MKFKDFSRTFHDLFKQIQGPSVPKKPSLFFCVNSAMSFTRFASEEKLSLRFCFHTLLYQRYYTCLVMTNSSFGLFSTVEGEQICPFQDFQGSQPKFKDFLGPGFFFY